MVKTTHGNVWLWESFDDSRFWCQEDRFEETSVSNKVSNIITDKVVTVRLDIEDTCDS